MAVGPSVAVAGVVFGKEFGLPAVAAVAVVDQGAVVALFLCGGFAGKFGDTEELEKIVVCEVADGFGGPFDFFESAEGAGGEAGQALFVG